MVSVQASCLCDKTYKVTFVFSVALHDLLHDHMTHDKHTVRHHNSKFCVQQRTKAQIQVNLDDLKEKQGSEVLVLHCVYNTVQIVVW